ncbi:arginine--tRNA ligase [Rubinisphaera sp.]|uniref:arginine--tRNA ligase n=3 Tax=Rubinisphaera TaxID=1649490 RepID=UPI000C0D8725|nr:arginine--tRNA ligase [Rubinisphaera sp.]MBV11290.1 arginine--tRNA ligase [Rubinisphaera sp.]HCS53528.1 arginine--tRNA ligase [Planctomycetaceae bacterium]
MNLLEVLRNRFQSVLENKVEDPGRYIAMVLPAQNAQFGDYQANCAMPLSKVLGKPPREVAADLIAEVDVSDLCEPPEIAGPGFINLKLKTDLLEQEFAKVFTSERLGVEPVASPEKIVIDYSSPNVAKPMHVGHLRSTVIGDALYKILSFLGHDLTSDNHIGDWGTQFGMILYGYRNFVDQEAYKKEPVAELSRLYRLVNKLSEYHTTVEMLPGLEWKLGEAEQAVNDAEAQFEQDDKQGKKQLKKLRSDLESIRQSVTKAESLVAEIEEDEIYGPLAAAHPNIHTDARLETSKLHGGDAENRKLWDEFLPACLDVMNVIYNRLHIKFDYSLGESFYQPQLADVVEELKSKGLAEESQKAMCVFLPDFKAPFIVQKQDGAFTYATTDLATIRYRVETLKATSILYVVDARQGEHFQMLFGTARRWGYENLNMQHVSFGTVMGQDGKPFKTRSGDTVGLGELLDEAISRAFSIVVANDESKPNGPELDEAERKQIAEIVGLGGIKYADLHHNRESDYIFDWDKMLSMTGDTATYMQYAYARVCGIFRKADVERDAIRQREDVSIQLTHEAERALGLQLLRFSEALSATAQELKPNLLTNYLFETANAFSTFYDRCPVAKENDEAVRISRLKLCDVTARTLKQGLNLLGIETSERM